MEEAASKGKSGGELATCTEAIRQALKPVADAICACPGVLAAALWWRLGADEGIARAANPGAPVESAADVTMSALVRGIEFIDPPLDGSAAASTREMNALCNRNPLISAFARAGKIGDAEARIVVLADKAAGETRIMPALELGWCAEGAAVAAVEKDQAREFWHARATKAAEECSRVRAERAAAARRHRAELAALQKELADQRARAVKLALRMFAAVDEERARIARDLHDDQAQLIAAAQVAFEQGGDQARRIFRRASEELGRSIRGLRSAMLGEQDLERALRAEFRLLAEAGIQPKLTLGPGARRLSRSAQQLCWHVAREALANVIRHSKASLVEVAILRQAAGAVISITDNGRGVAPKSGRDRDGLDGLGVRLRLMGGSVAVESAPGMTRVVAEIPEIA